MCSIKYAYVVLLSFISQLLYLILCIVDAVSNYLLLSVWLYLRSNIRTSVGKCYTRQYPWMPYIHRMGVDLNPFYGYLQNNDCLAD